MWLEVVVQKMCNCTVVVEKKIESFRLHTAINKKEKVGLGTHGGRARMVGLGEKSNLTLALTYLWFGRFCWSDVRRPVSQWFPALGRFASKSIVFIQCHSSSIRHVEDVFTVILLDVNHDVIMSVQTFDDVEDILNFERFQGAPSRSNILFAGESVKTREVWSLFRTTTNGLYVIK
jgi:hypothetical protein